MKLLLRTCLRVLTSLLGFFCYFMTEANKQKKPTSKKQVWILITSLVKVAGPFNLRELIFNHIINRSHVVILFCKIAQTVRVANIFQIVFLDLWQSLL